MNEKNINQKVWHALKTVGDIFIILVTLDLMILMAAILQVAAGQPTGYWHPFWLVQAKILLSLFN